MTENGWPEDWFTQMVVAAAGMVGELKTVPEDSPLFKTGMSILRSINKELKPASDSKREPAKVIGIIGGKVDKPL